MSKENHPTWPAWYRQATEEVWTMTRLCAKLILVFSLRCLWNDIVGFTIVVIFFLFQSTAHCESWQDPSSNRLCDRPKFKCVSSHIPLAYILQSVQRQGRSPVCACIESGVCNYAASLYNRAFNNGCTTVQKNTHMLQLHCWSWRKVHSSIYAPYFQIL